MADGAVDIPRVSRKDEPTAVAPASRAPRSGLLMMGVILLAMASLALYSNYQKSHVEQIETVTIIAPSPPEISPTSAPSPRGR